MLDSDLEIVNFFFFFIFKITLEHVINHAFKINLVSSSTLLVHLHTIKKDFEYILKVNQVTENYS